MDSGELRIEVTSRAAALTVVTPAGTFLQAFDTNLPIAEWTRGAAALRTASDRASSPVVSLRSGGNTEFSLELTTDTAFVLSGTNGAWPFGIRVSATQFDALLAATEGVRAEGAVEYDLPRSGQSRSNDRPDVSGAWLEHQVDRPASHGPRPPRVSYPSVMRGSGEVAVVRLSFIIDSTGRVPPTSVRVIGFANPAFAIVARKALLDARFGLPNGTGVRFRSGGFKNSDSGSRS